jgi:hypothetical protein
VLHVVSDADSKGSRSAFLEAIEKTQPELGRRRKRGTGRDEYHAGGHPWRGILEDRKVDAEKRVVHAPFSSQKNESQIRFMNELSNRQGFHDSSQYSRDIVCLRDASVEVAHGWSLSAPP